MSDSIAAETPSPSKTKGTKRKRGSSTGIGSGSGRRQQKFVDKLKARKNEEGTKNRCDICSDHMLVSDQTAAHVIAHGFREVGIATTIILQS